MAGHAHQGYLIANDWPPDGQDTGALLHDAGGALVYRDEKHVVISETTKPSLSGIQRHPFEGWQFSDTDMPAWDNLIQFDAVVPDIETHNADVVTYGTPFGVKVEYTSGNFKYMVARIQRAADLYKFTDNGVRYWALEVFGDVYFAYTGGDYVTKDTPFSAAEIRAYGEYTHDANRIELSFYELYIRQRKKGYGNSLEFSGAYHSALAAAMAASAQPYRAFVSSGVYSLAATSLGQ